MNETLNVGDEVLIRLVSELDPKVFGSGWRMGKIIGLPTDLIAGEPIVILDDYGPRIYAAHIDYVTVLSSASHGRAA